MGDDSGKKLDEKVGEPDERCLEIERSLERLKLVFDSMSDGVTVHDLRFNIETHNPAMEKFLIGNAIDGHKCFNVIHGTDRPPEFCPMMKTIPSGKTAICDFFEPNLDKYLTIRTDPIYDDDGKLRQIVHIVRDITERKLLEKSLREANATKDKFFSILAHDLRNPLGSFMTMSEVLADNLERMSHVDLQDQMGMMARTSKAVYNLLENLLDWARVQTGQIKYNPEFADVDEIADEVIDLLDGASRNKNIKLVADIEPGLNGFFDPKMVTTVIRNLVSNAIKFTDVGGRVVIRASMAGDEILVDVSDDGVGMCDADIEKLFRIDVHHTTIGTGQEKGTGLGLVMCKEFVEMNGGHIACSSREGEGSTFSFTLPVNPPRRNG